MFFTASIKPTSTVQTRWTARSQACGFIQGVCFVRHKANGGWRYTADKLTEAQVLQLRDNPAVRIAFAAIRVPEKIEELPELDPVEPEPVEEVNSIPAPPKRVKGR